VNPVRDMRSNLKYDPLLGDFGVRSDFLGALRADWRRSDFGNKFLAAAGRSCSTRVRSIPPYGENGCRVINPYSDGVVCEDSAGLYYPDSGIGPTTQYLDTFGTFQHAANIGPPCFKVLCGGTSHDPISSPSPSSLLFAQIKEFILALP